MTQPADSLSERIHALIFNGITRASAQRADFWMPLTERERMTQAVYAELRAGNIEFRLGGLALLAEAVDHEARLTAGTQPTCLGRDMDCGRPLPCPDHGAPAAETETR
ncbi:MAG: hypothetical protein JWO11_4482 [Nocardioides sp.]|nr:hypothetical protein [Nocardioides sp.]